MSTKLHRRLLDGSITAPRCSSSMRGCWLMRRRGASLPKSECGLRARGDGRRLDEKRSAGDPPNRLAHGITSLDRRSGQCGAAVGNGWWWQDSQRAFATVEKAAGVVEMTDGSALRGEPHEIIAGSVSLVTARGARIVIEAPAEFYFESAQRLHMKRGRLAADVPPAAKGFTVVTPSGDAIDLGTRFGVDVPSTGAAEVHVFQGEVITKASGAQGRQNLRGGDAVMFDAGASTSRELRSSAFIQPDELPALTAGLAAGQRARVQMQRWRN
jgi:uncharacterized cupin superfamily protein